MKLRQKLAVVLASAMAVTAVPVVTMAASTNSLSKETQKVEKDFKFTDATTANALKVKFTDNNSNPEVFYLDLDNAKWDTSTLEAAEKAGVFEKTGDDEWTYKGSVKVNGTDTAYKVIYERQNDTTMKITIPTVPTTEQPLQIPIVAQAKDGDAKVSVVSKGGLTTVSQGSFVFATTADKKVSFTVGDLNSFYTKGKLADITLEETFKGSLAGKTAVIKLSLDDSDWVFDYAVGDKIDVEKKYGFSNQTVSAKVTKMGDSDKGYMEITVDATGATNAATIGQVILKNIAVKSNVKAPEEGDFLVDIKGDDVLGAKDNVVLAKIAKYATYIKMKDDKAVDIKAGRIDDVEFTVGEDVEDSIVGGREFEMTLENGHFDYKTLIYKYGTPKDEDGNAITSDNKKDDIDKKKSDGRLDVAKMYKDDVLKDAKFDYNGTKDIKLITGMYFDTNSDGEIIPETLIVELDSRAQVNKNNDKMTFKLPVCAPVDNKDKESIKITASGRALENEVTTTVVNIVNPFNVTFEQAVLKVGLQDQVGGKVVLTETDKEMFQKGKITFKVKKDDEVYNIYLKDVKVETSGGIKGTKTNVNKGKDNNVEITLNRDSKAASTLTLSEFKFTTDRTVPEGTYDLEISGTGIDADGHSLTVKDFIKISTTNTQDITASGMAKGVAKFVIGESKYTLNDKEVTMDAPSYIQDPGYTMVPVRYVANAFGVSDADILFGKGTVTIFAGERTISLTTGSNIAVVNGNNVAMTTKVVNKDGRTYVPAGQIASLLGIKSTWDSATKTATFENN